MALFQLDAGHDAVSRSYLHDVLAVKGSIFCMHHLLTCRTSATHFQAGTPCFVSITNT